MLEVEIGNRLLTQLGYSKRHTISGPDDESDRGWFALWEPDVANLTVSLVFRLVQPPMCLAWEAGSGSKARTDTGKCEVPDRTILIAHSPVVLQEGRDGHALQAREQKTRSWQ